MSDRKLYEKWLRPYCKRNNLPFGLVGAWDAWQAAVTAERKRWREKLQIAKDRMIGDGSVLDAMNEALEESQRTIADNVADAIRRGEGEGR